MQLDPIAMKPDMSLKQLLFSMPDLVLKAFSAGHGKKREELPTDFLEMMPMIFNGYPIPSSQIWVGECELNFVG